MLLQTTAQLEAERQFSYTLRLEAQRLKLEWDQAMDASDRLEREKQELVQQLQLFQVRTASRKKLSALGHAEYLQDQTLFFSQNCAVYMVIHECRLIWLAMTAQIAVWHAGGGSSK